MLFRTNPDRSPDAKEGNQVAQDLRLFSSESVTEGHPDKICDSISDSILDALIAVDPEARVAVETVVTTGLVHVVGEVSTTGYVDIPRIVRQRLRDIGFDSSEKGFDGTTCGVSLSIGEQSPEISEGVTESLEARSAEGDIEDEDRAGAGDQGLMFGYAVRETPELMPLPISLAHRLARRLTQVRKLHILDYLRPDGKTQVTVGYDNEDRPVALDTVVISTQHNPGIPHEQMVADLKREVIDPVLATEGLPDLDTSNLKLLINPSGSFIVGGPMGDAGLTGRKIIVDTYGGMARHGGGAFSGKDPSKVDRSAAYAMRWVAKNVVAAGLAERVEVQVAYAIGRANPVGLYVETFGTGTVDRRTIEDAIRKVFDLRPAAIIRELDLKRPIYAQTSAYGHFGRTDVDLPWERVNRVADLRAAAGV